MPRQFRENFAKLIQLRLDSGFIRPSSSAFASPSFIIPKADKSALPRWVCDYCQLNANTVPDNFTLPHVDDILADCAKGKIWAIINMTDSFFQTRMHPDDIHKRPSPLLLVIMSGVSCLWAFPQLAGYTSKKSDKCLT